MSLAHWLLEISSCLSECLFGVEWVHNWFGQHSVWSLSNRWRPGKLKNPKPFQSGNTAYKELPHVSKTSQEEALKSKKPFRNKQYIFTTQNLYVTTSGCEEARESITFLQITGRLYRIQLTRCLFLSFWDEKHTGFRTAASFLEISELR